jgi:hypothetical protein
MAELVYCSTADAARDLNRRVGLTLEGSNEGDRSKMELCERRVDHWYWVEDEGVDIFEGAEGGAGIKDQVEEGSLYMSRSDGGEVITLM